MILLCGLFTGCLFKKEKVPDGPVVEAPDAAMQAFPGIEWVEIGRSVEGRPIHMVEFGSGDDVTLFFSCFHGNERSTPRFALEIAQMIHRDPSLVAPGKRVVIVPILNPDGFQKGTRRNARGVDLNRNYPTSNWGQQPERRGRVAFGEAPASEPETQVVLRLMEQIPPTKILSVHQPLECNNPDGPAGMGLALLLAQYNGYPVEPYIGFPTPGSYGTYAGKELKIPMVTLELPQGKPDEPIFDKMWEDNREGLLAFVNSNLADLETGE
jgi:protein MpaA